MSDGGLQRDGREGQQRLRQVAGHVQQAVGRLRVGRGQSLGPLLQEGLRKGGAVGQSGSRQRRGGVRPHLIQSQSGLLTVERVRGRRRAQTWDRQSESFYMVKTRHIYTTVQKCKSKFSHLTERGFCSWPAGWLESVCPSSRGRRRWARGTLQGSGTVWGSPCLGEARGERGQRPPDCRSPVRSLECPPPTPRTDRHLEREMRMSFNSTQRGKRA